MKTEFYVIKLDKTSYWLRDFGSRHLISGSVGTPFKATQIELEPSNKLLPELRKIFPKASVVKVKVNYAEETCV